MLRCGQHAARVGGYCSEPADGPPRGASIPRSRAVVRWILTAARLANVSLTCRRQCHRTVQRRLLPAPARSLDVTHVSGHLTRRTACGFARSARDGAGTARACRRRFARRPGLRLLLGFLLFFLRLGGEGGTQCEACRDERDRETAAQVCVAPRRVPIIMLHAGFPPIRWRLRPRAVSNSSASYAAGVHRLRFASATRALAVSVSGTPASRADRSRSALRKARPAPTRRCPALLAPSAP